MRSLSLKNWFVVLACVALLAASLIGQDLGSSNKLFGAAKTKTSAARPPVKKPAAKPKTTVAKAKKPPRNTAQPPKTTRTNAQKNQSTAARSKFTEFKSVQPTKVEINVGQRKITKPAAATNSNSDDLFEELIDDGNSNRDDRNYSAAEAAYKRARTIKPRDSRAVYGLGNLYSDQQRWEEAENSYRAAVQLEPSNAIAHIALSYVLTQPIAAPNLSQRYEEAEQVARRAIDLAPSNALAFDQLGVALEMRGLIGAETENAYRKAIQLRSSFAPAYAHLGRLLRRRGLTRESEAAYKSAVGRSTDIATTILVADVMQSEQRFAESEALLRSSLAGDPKNPSALLLLGRALTAQAKYAEAEKVLRSSLNVSPNAFTANSLLATVYVRQGSFDLAENALLQAVRFVSPLEKRSLSQQFESLGDGYLKAGNASGAERSYRQAIGLDNENQSLVGKLAKAQRG